MMNKKLPIYCPSCQNNLNVQGLICEACHTVVTGSYNLPVLLKLSSEQQQFVVDFVKSSGSLKDMAGKLGLSYPTVRNMLDAIINDLKKDEISPV
jgi:hypothetical protein